MIETKLDGRALARRATPWLTVLSALALAACSATPDWANPVEWYKGATSIFDDEPQAPPANEAAAEMAKKPIPGEGQPFPNLASVPERPKSVTPSDERKKITDALVSDRANARYVEAPAQRTAPGSGSVPAPSQTAPDVTPSPRPPVTSTPASPAPSPSPSSVPDPESSAGVPPAEPPPAAVPPPRPKAEAPHPNPAPVASAVPPAPPPPARVAPPPAPEVAAATAPALKSGNSLVVEPSGEVKAAPAGAGGTHPVPATSGTPASMPTGHIPGTVPMAVVLFNEGGTQISAQQRQGLGAVVHEAKVRGATVRVVGHASPPRNPGSSASLVNNFHVAMDRAQSVATALIKLGLPAARVKVEADTSPDSVPDVANVPPGDAGLRRTDVFLE